MMKATTLLFGAFCLLALNMTTLLRPAAASPEGCLGQYSTCEEVEQNIGAIVLCMLNECIDDVYWPCIVDYCYPYDPYFCQYDPGAQAYCEAMVGDCWYDAQVWGDNWYNQNCR